MKILTKIRLSLITTVILVLTVIGITLFFIFAFQQSHKKQQFAQRITETSFQMALLRSEYYIHPSERPKTQWINMHEVLSRFLDEAKPLFSKTEEKALFEDTRKVFADSGFLLGQLVQNIEQGGNETVREELFNQLTVKSQTRVSNVLRLSELSRAEAENILYLFEFVLIILGLILVGIYILSYFITSSVVTSLKELEKEFTRISVLDFSSTTTTTTTTTGSKDEIGMLRRVFNIMVEKLKTSYATLEDKIQERTGELSRKTYEAEESKKATLNILEDLKSEKEKVEVTTKALTKAQELAHIGNWDWDIKNNIVTWSPELYNIFGIDPIPLSYDSYLQHVYVDDQELARKTVERALKDYQPFEFDHRTKLADGTLRWIRGKGRVFVENGIPVKMEGTAQDITKEKEIDKAKNEFVSLASHQLRTPLSTINWYAEMLLAGDAGKITSEQKKYLDEIYTGNQRMVELVNALLNVSRLELGTFVIEPEPTDATLLMRSVIDEQKPQIDERKIKTSCSFEKNIPCIQTDPRLLRMVVQNLLSNAVKYTPEGGKVRLFLSLDKEKKNLLMKVSDTGYGIPKNQQDKIFTKLFRADNAREKDTEGIGLGLYIVKSIIEHSGGKIWFESDENKGTTFFATLPLEGMKKKVGTKVLA